jgi:predicted small lipoprotein YifL
MRLRSLLLLAALACGCATGRKGPPLCPESTKVCLNDQRCELDRSRDCMLCVCRAWNDSGPRTGGPAGNAQPESLPTVPPPPTSK